MAKRKPSAGPEVPRRTVGYVQVSSEDQALKGGSLDAQEALIRAYAMAHDRELDEVIADAGVSAKTLDRPGMGRILAGVRDRSIGMVVALKLDRLTRSTRDLGEVLELFAARRRRARLREREPRYADSRRPDARLDARRRAAVEREALRTDSERSRGALLHSSSR